MTGEVTRLHGQPGVYARQGYAKQLNLALRADQLALVDAAVRAEAEREGDWEVPRGMLAREALLIGLEVLAERDERGWVRYERQIVWRKRETAAARLVARAEGEVLPTGS